MTGVPPHLGSVEARPERAPVTSAWRLAYLITGDRDAAQDIVAAAREALGPAGTTTSERELRLAVARRARRWVGQHRDAHHDPLWAALRGLPRRQRAEIVQRLR